MYGIFSQSLEDYRKNFLSLVAKNISTKEISVNSSSTLASTDIKGIHYGSFTMTPNNGAAISTFATQNQTISGISVGDVISLDISGTAAAYVGFERAFISSENTLTVIWRNLHHSTAAADNITNADANVKTFRYLWFDLT